MNTIPSPLLYNAALRGDMDTVLAELAAGVSPDTPCTEDGLTGETPLMAALFHERVDVARVLLEAGACITPAVAGKFTDACSFHFNGSRADAMLQLLLEYGLAPNTTLEWGNTLLMCFAGNPKYLPCMRILLDHGADVNARGCYQRTAFMSAAFSDAEEPLRLLLVHGADANAQDELGRTALMQVILNRVYHEDAEMLTDVGDELCYYQSVNGNPRDTEEMLPRLCTLLRCGAEPNVRDHKGWNALLFCLAIGQAEAARLLMTSGASLEGLDRRIIHRARCCMKLHGFADALRLLDECCAPNAEAELAPVPTQRRNFFIRRDQHRGTAYINLQSGTFDEEFGWADFSWDAHADAPCISDDDIYTSGLAFLLEEIIPDYSIYEVYNITREQWDAIDAAARHRGGKVAQAVGEIRSWVEGCFARGEGFCILGV